jgi:hypothetical protein
MAIEVTINSVTGQSPYDIYICQTGGTGCFYMATITSVPYTFTIPQPYNTSTSYMLKLIDNNGCIITGVQNVEVCVTPTVTPTSTTTPTVTPTQTNTPSITPSPVVYSGVFCTGNTQNDACICTGSTTLYSSQPFFTSSQQVYIDSSLTTWAPFGLYMTSGGTSYQYQYTMFAPGLVSLGSCPSPTPTITTTPTNTPTITTTNTPTRTPGMTPTNTSTNTPTQTPTTTSTSTPTVTQTPTNTSTNTPTMTETPTQTPTPTITDTPTQTPTPTITDTPTQTPTPTSTPAVPVTYVGYLADEYVCGYDIGGAATGCTLTSSNIDVRFPTSYTPSTSRYYAPNPGGCSGSVYYIIGNSTNNTGPIIAGVTPHTVCTDACQEECPV